MSHSFQIFPNFLINKFQETHQTQVFVRRAVEGKTSRENGGTGSSFQLIKWNVKLDQRGGNNGYVLAFHQEYPSSIPGTDKFYVEFF